MQNPFQTMLRFQDFFKFFFKKSILFIVSNPILQRWETLGQKKINFSDLLFVQNPIQTMWRFQISQVFFQKINFFTVLIPYNAQVRKVSSAKNHFLVLFYSAKSISDHFTISELFQFLFSKYQFFSLFRTLYCKGEKNEVRKNHFLVLFSSTKSNSDHFTISNFSSSFQKN